VRVVFAAAVMVLFAALPQGQETAALSGVVVTDETSPRPVRQAIVTVSSTGLQRNRSVITDDQGRFAFGDLPAGRFTITVAKAAFITSAFGAKRPGGTGTPVALGTGQRVEGIRVPISRAGVITGTVRDEVGEPAPGVTVTAKTAAALSAYSAFMTPGADTAVADDQGSYRIFGLPPGEYVVFTNMRFAVAGELSAFSLAEIDSALLQLKQGPGRVESASGGPTSRPVIVAPTFYPGTARFAQAGRVPIAAGDERGGVDITIARVPTASVSGVVQSADGTPIRGASLDFELDGPNIDGSLRLFGGTSGDDGRFKIETVAPGDYVVSARATNQVSRSRVSVNGVDVSGVTLTMRRAPAVSGRVVFQATSLKAPTQFKGFGLVLRPDRGQSDPSQYITGTRTASVAADGSFSIASVLPGRYFIDLIASSGFMGGWMLRSAIVGGLDVVDTSLEVGDEDIAGVTVTMTDRTTELSGTLQTDAGMSATDYVVVVIPADRSLWLPNSRRMKVARPGTDGRFVIRHLPAGEYLIATVTDAEPEDLRDQALLAQLAAGGVKVTLAEGDRKVQDLKITR
jgi:hypothetical protein